MDPGTRRGGIAARWAASAKRTRRHHNSTDVPTCQGLFNPGAADFSGPSGPPSRPRDGGGPGARRATPALWAGARQGGPGAARDGRSGPRRGPRAPTPAGGPQRPGGGRKTNGPGTAAPGLARPPGRRARPRRSGGPRGAAAAGPTGGDPAQSPRRTTGPQPGPPWARPGPAPPKPQPGPEPRRPPLVRRSRRGKGAGAGMGPRIPKKPGPKGRATGTGGGRGESEPSPVASDQSAPGARTRDLPQQHPRVRGRSPAERAQRAGTAQPDQGRPKGGPST